MSIKQVWLNLPVKDIQKSKEFFKQIGFIPNPMHEKAEHLGSFFIGENKFVLMLFPENIFKGFINHSISEPKIGSEMLINFDAESKEEVDMMAEKVRQAGGIIYAEPGESQGWMYAFGFIDLDGHRWSMLYMDMKKMPK
jgi:predicted lactoylglutathione lyase